MSSLVVNKAQVEIAKADLDKSVVLAKRNGIVTQKNVEQGEFVSPGKSMIQVVDHRKILVDGQLSESQVSKVKVGAKAKVSIRALNKEYMGQVQAILPVADPASRTFKVRVKVKNPNFQILVGMAATISIALRHYDKVILVKQDVVLEEGESRSIFIIGKDGKAQKRKVKLGPVDQDRVVLLDGVKPGEKLVVLGQRELKDGQRVTVIQ
jgi:RND family efflux transporter MFP subunit